MEWNENHTRIKKALQENKALAKQYTQTNKENAWNIYNSWLESYARTFRESMPDAWLKKSEDYLSSSNIFRDYIRETLSISERSGDLVGIEFGGPGSNLFAGMYKNLFKTTAGVCLSDIRTEFQKKGDEERNHKVITADILDTSGKSLDYVKSKLKIDKVDLIISRMAGPLDYINMDLDVLDRIFRDWYKILNQNGLMFIQFRYSIDDKSDIFRTKLESWKDTIEKKFPNIEIQIGTYCCFRVHKRNGSPEELPSIKELFNGVN